MSELKNGTEVRPRRFRDKLTIATGLTIALAVPGCGSAKGEDKRPPVTVVEAEPSTPQATEPAERPRLAAELGYVELPELKPILFQQMQGLLPGVVFSEDSRAYIKEDPVEYYRFMSLIISDNPDGLGERVEVAVAASQDGASIACHNLATTEDKGVTPDWILALLKKAAVLFPADASGARDFEIWFDDSLSGFRLTCTRFKEEMKRLDPPVEGGAPA